MAYNEKDYKRAVDHYRGALLEIEELIKEVNKQEEDENNLSPAEQEELKRKADREDLNWDTEKEFLNESLIDRKQQLCMGLRAELNDIPLEISEVRLKLKEINKYQSEILQFYALTRKSFLNLLKIMIDIAENFQALKYYHSGLELLDIVSDELKKLDGSSGEGIDIDITRLSRIGVNIKIEDEHNKRLHFISEECTFQKDILIQMMHYRKGLLLLENDRHYEAGLAFTLAIVIFT